MLHDYIHEPAFIKQTGFLWVIVCMLKFRLYKHIRLEENSISWSIILFNWQSSICDLFSSVQVKK